MQRAGGKIDAEYDIAEQVRELVDIYLLINGWHDANLTA